LDNEVTGVTGSHFTTFFRELDTRTLRWWGIDPEISKSPWESPYLSMGGNPVIYYDPLGNLKDWYQSEAGNVIWQEGSTESINVNGEEFTNIGTSYTFSSSLLGNDAVIHYEQNTPTLVDLTSDEGKKYRMIAAEGGWVKQNGETKRETDYGLLIIAASMENRLKYPNYFPNEGTYESLYNPKQYNAVNSATYKNFSSQITKWEIWYGTKDVMSYLDNIYKAAYGNSVNKLQQDYNFSNADKILGYAHINSNLFGKYTVNLNFDKDNTLIKVVQSSSNIFPSLK
jgi:hypothetical protein